MDTVDVEMDVRLDDNQENSKNKETARGCAEREREKNIRIDHLNLSAVYAFISFLSVQLTRTNLDGQRRGNGPYSELNLRS